MLICSLVWSEPVVGAPGADNLKIRPEFFPEGEAVSNFSFLLLKYTSNLIKLIVIQWFIFIHAQAEIHAASAILWFLCAG